MRRKMIFGIAVVCCLGTMAACAVQKDAVPEAQSSGQTPGPDSAGKTAGEAYHKITAEEAKKMLDEGGATVVDVRTEEEYKEQHIPGAVLVPNETIGEEAPEALPDKDAVLLVHCRTGVRSKQASDKLVDLGYKNIYDFGGIVDWPYETESGEAEKP